MRAIRAFPVALPIAVAASLLTAAPALASFGAVVDVPASRYSPYGGPATVRFTFAPSDDPSIFTVRLRELGQPALKEKDYLVDPAVHASPHDVSFSWPELTVATATEYVIDVRPQGGGAAITSESFTVLPRLVADVSVSPTRFYPLIDDGYRDTTKVSFTLATDTSETNVRIFRADAYGRCCGKEIRTEELGPRAAGTRRWTWDGTRDDGSAATKGTYYVKVSATDTDAVSATSRARPVTIATGTIRRTVTRTKAGSAYARTADEVQTAIGGDCNVSRDTDTKTASILCANAEISVVWSWKLSSGERIESVSFAIDEGYYGCKRTKRHTKSTSSIRVYPTSICYVRSASATISYPVQV